MLKNLFACLVLLCFDFPCHSQVVNIESARMQSDSVGWKGRAGTVFSFTSNKQDITQFSIDAHLQLKTVKDLWLIIGDYGFLKGGGEKFVQNSFGHLRYNRKLNSFLRWEVFLQAQNNYITQIDSRYLAGTGPRFKLSDTKRFRLYAASLFMYEYEKELTTPTLIHRDVRNSSYVSFTILPDEHMEIISTTFFQPRLGAFGDFRVLNQALLKIKTGKRFGVSVIWNYLFDRFPAGEAPKTTYNFAMGLDCEF